MAKTKTTVTSLAKSEGNTASIPPSAQSTAEAPTGLLDYLAECSETGLDSFQLNRLGRAASFRTEFRAILENWIQVHAEARFASWCRQYVQRRGEPVPASTARAELPEIPGTGIMEPWFRTRKQAGAIRRAQSTADRNKWSAFFFLYGCVICGSTTVAYFSNGMCETCHQRTCNRLAGIVREPRRGQGS